MAILDKLMAVIEPDTGRVLDPARQPALAKAAQLAGYAKASLELILSESNSYLDDGFFFEPLQAQKLRQEHGEKQLARLEEMARPLRDQGLEVMVTAAWSHPPYEQIVARARAAKPSLVVKATRGKSRLARLFLSNEDWELVRRCPAPLLLSKTPKWQEKPVFLAAVDPGHAHDKPAALDHRIIRAGLDLAAVAGGELRLFHSAWTPPLSGVYPLTADAAQLEGRLRAMAAEHGIPDSHVHLATDNVESSLPAMARELNASAVVMGAVSRSTLDRLLIGNTAERVLDDIECDVVVIKPEAASAA